MKRHWPVLLALMMLMSAVLACGFPLPLGGNLSLMSVPACAAEEPAASCEARQAAYEAMAALDSVSVIDLNVYVLVNTEDDQMELSASGRYDYVVTQTENDPQPSVHVWLDEMTLVQEETEQHDGLEIILVGNEGYALEAGESTWKHKPLDSDAANGLSMMLGMPLSDQMMPGFFSDPAAFSAALTKEKDAAQQQSLQVHTLTVDLESMLSSPELLGSLMAAGSQNPALGGMDMGDSEEMTAMAPMFLSFMQGTVIENKISIGADGLIHAFDQTLSIKLDLSAVDSEAAPMEITYILSGRFENFNGVGEIMAPADFVEAGEDSIFGGMGAPGG